MNYRVFQNIGPTLFLSFSFLGSGSRTEELLTLIQQPENLLHMIALTRILKIVLEIAVPLYVLQNPRK